MPRGLLLGLLTLIALAFLTLFLSAGIAPGAKEVGSSTEPLFLGFQTIFGDGIGVKVLAMIAAAGLIASFHAIIYAYGRNIYSLARAGYFPKWLSVTHGERKTPHVALFAGALLGFVVALAMQYSGSKLVGAALLNMAVFGAMISYIMQLLSFILLRSKLPHIERPFVSPLGVPGADPGADHRGRDADIAVPQPGVPAGRLGLRHLVPGRHRLFRPLRPPSSGEVAGRSLRHRPPLEERRHGARLGRLARG